MANLIIKSSANDLVIQGSDESPAITVAAAGTTTFAENTTLSGTANNLGTVTAGTFEGTLNSSTTFSGNAGEITAKIWCRYNQSTPAIGDSYGVSSVTDVSTGRWKTNFTTNMANAYYCVQYTAEDDRFQTIDTSATALVGSVQCRTTHYNGNSYDQSLNNVLIFGDQ